MTLDKHYPPFSVLMSVYKNENPKYLNIALNSIEKQTVKPTEIVIVEDGPIPHSLKDVILKHQKDFGSGFIDVMSKKNQGLGAAMRLGTKYVTTNWIARMDSDDYSLPYRFEKQLDLIVRNPHIAIVGGQVSEFIENDINKIVGYRKVPVSEQLIRQFIKWRSPFNHPTVMINKSVLQAVGGYKPFGNLEDYYLWARVIVNNYSIQNLSKVLVNMRVDKGIYKRRGKVSNIKYFYRLRHFLFKNSVLTKQEEIIGDCLMTLNIVIPGWLRKNIYRQVLHKK